MRFTTIALACLAALALGALAASDSLAKKGGGGKPPPDPITNPALAYVMGNNVYVMTADGSTKQKLTGGNVSRASPAWSPDGTRIAYLQQGELFLMDADGSNAAGTGVTAGGGWIDWFPDGSKILMYQSLDLKVYDVDTGGVQALGLTDHHPNVGGWTGSVGPDLDATTDGFQGVICYSAPVDLPDNPSDLHVVEVSEDASGTLSIDPLTITALDLAGNQAWPAFSPDGTQIAFLGPPAHASGGADLQIVDFDAATLTFGAVQLVLDEGGIGPRLSWSPDAQWIAFQWSGDLYRIQPDGTALTNVTSSRKDEWDPNWNPAWTNDL